MSAPQDLIERPELLKTLELLLPHRPPFRLVDRLLSATSTEAVAERRITHGDPLVGDALPAPLLIEALAQTAALMVSSTEGAHEGFLVALKDVKFDGAVRVGDTLTLRARRTATLGALHRVEAEARVGELVVARGELTFSVTPSSVTPSS